jgi:hypothetical protein
MEFRMKKIDRELADTLKESGLQAITDSMDRIVIAVTDHLSKKTVLDILDICRRVDPNAKAVERTGLQPLYSIMVRGSKISLVAEKIKAPLFQQDVTRHIKDLIDVTIMALGSFDLVIKGVNRTYRLNQLDKPSVSSTPFMIRGKSVQFTDRGKKDIEVKVIPEIYQRAKKTLELKKLIDYKGEARESVNLVLSNVVAAKCLKDVTGLGFKGFDYSPQSGLTLNFETVVTMPSDLPSGMSLTFVVLKGCSSDQGKLVPYSSANGFNKKIPL